MTLRILTATLLTLLTTPALAQDTPQLVEPSDPETRQEKPQTPARPQAPAQAKPTPDLYLQFSFRAERVLQCGKVIAFEKTRAVLEVDGKRRDFAIKDLYNQQLGSSCQAARQAARQAKRERARRDSIASPSAPQEAPKTRTETPEDWFLMPLLGGAAAAGLGVGGYVLGNELCSAGDYECSFYSGVMLGGLGVMVASTATVYGFGTFRRREGSLVVTALGGVLGTGAGFLLGTQGQSFEAVLIGTSLGAGLGATMGYMWTDTSEGSVAILPTRGGAYATYGLEF